MHLYTHLEVAIASPGEIPMPNQSLAGGIVIASCYYREAGDETIPENMRDERWADTLYTLLILNEESPYYTVGTGWWDPDGTFVWTNAENHGNIVPAAEAYNDEGGAY